MKLAQKMKNIADKSDYNPIINMYSKTIHEIEQAANQGKYDVEVIFQKPFFHITQTTKQTFIKNLKMDGFKVDESNDLYKYNITWSGK